MAEVQGPNDDPIWVLGMSILDWHFKEYYAKRMLNFPFVIV